MIQPISFNVIQQAIQWHGLPTPGLQTLSISGMDREAMRAEYEAVWPEHVIPQRYFGPQVPEWYDGVAHFKGDLQDCFCEDVHVVNCRWDDLKQQMIAVLYIRVDRSRPNQPYLLP